MKKEELAGSATEGTFRRLRAQILSCHLRPGAKLKIAELQQLLGVSQGAIRESLSRLTAEDLVVAEPQRGFFVAPISEALLKDTYAARIDVESATLARSISNGDAVWEGNLVGALHRLLRTTEPTGLDDPNLDVWFNAHNYFHDMLTAACDVKTLLRIRHQLFEQTERYRRVAFPAPHAVRDSRGEHQALCDAALARDLTGCIRLMREHLETTMADVCLALKESAPVARAAPAAGVTVRKAGVGRRRARALPRRRSVNTQS